METAIKQINNSVVLIHTNLHLIADAYPLGLFAGLTLHLAAPVEAAVAPLIRNFLN